MRKQEKKQGIEIEKVLVEGQEIINRQFHITTDEAIQYIELLKTFVKTVFPEAKNVHSIHSPRSREFPLFLDGIGVRARIDFSPKSYVRIEVRLTRHGGLILKSVYFSKGIYRYPKESYYRGTLRNLQDIEKWKEVIGNLKVYDSLIS